MQEGRFDSVGNVYISQSSVVTFNTINAASVTELGITGNSTV
jgi:hypothetical protein